MKDGYILITTTFDNLNKAKEVINILLEQHLISCAQMINIESFYHWKEDINNEKEILVQMKTKKELYKQIEKIILDNHNYEIPQIVSYDIENGYDKYLKWIQQETI